jgi:hypothetical protein
MATKGETVLRTLTWVGFVLCPIAFTLAMMDFGAHGDASTPGIGLEGAGRPGGASTPLMMIALVGIVGGFVARMSGPEPRVSLLRLAGVGALTFAATLVLSRPIFHAKWEHDCDRGVARACTALARLRVSGDPEGLALARKACGLGDPGGCKRLAEGAQADKEEACRARDAGCREGGGWGEAGCKDLAGACGAISAK